MDVAMTALRKGAEEISLVCLECREEMPAWESEIQMALEEGIEVVNCLGPHRLLSQDGTFTGVEFKRCTHVYDDDGSFNPQYDETDLTSLSADTVIVAIGQVADLSYVKKLGITISSNGGLQADPLTLETAIEGVFAGGDVVSGPQSVALAIGSGREAARSINRYLSGRNLRLGRLGLDKTLRAIKEPQIEIFDPSSRAEMSHLEPKVRIQSFDEVQRGFTEDMAVQEGNRCIMCGASCVQSCPYDVMQFNHEIYKAVKCDLCVEKRTKGEAPACTTVCPTRCIFWGDPETFPNGFRKVL
jgi:NADPH-dependent glutamate synthase beta subunit-like oxidoreductase